MKVAERRAKIRALIEQELTDVESEDLVGYLNVVIQSIAVLKLAASAENWDELPQAKIIDIIDAAGSTLIFHRDLLKEVLQLLESR
jgi:hypothetical protein